MAAMLVASSFGLAKADSDFDLAEIAGSSTGVAAIEALVSATSTAGIDSVTAGPSGTIHIVHQSSTFVETFLNINPDSDPLSGTIYRTESQIATDLGFGGTVVMEAGFTASADGRYIYFAASDSADVDGEIVLARIDTQTGPHTAVAILAGADLDDLADQAVLLNGQIVAVRGEAGVGIIDPEAGTPAWTEVVSENDLKAILIAAGVPAPTVPVESVAVHPVTGDVYVFAHDVKELFKITNITTTPVVERIVVPGWPGVVDFHGMGIDRNGIFFGLDEAAESIKIWDGTNVFEYTFEELGEILEEAGGKSLKHGDAELTLWRGIAVTNDADDNPLLILGWQGDEFGVAVMNFTEEGVLSARSWQRYQ
jgi:hypothetical protein